MFGAILGGKVHQARLDNWLITWEADGKYRHWCTQVREDRTTAPFAAICLFNPGSLSGDGSSLREDTTLRILREVFNGSPFGCLIINLFDRATPRPPDLFNDWNERDKAHSPLVYGRLPNPSVFLKAYGDYENRRNPTIAHDIRTRLADFEKWSSGFRQIQTPLNKSKTPKHVMRWQIEKLKDKMKALVAVNC